MRYKHQFRINDESGTAIKEKMRKSVLTILATAALLFGSPSHAFNLSDLFGSSTAGSALGGLVEGLLTKQNLQISDLEGTWTATGSAVTFQSENYLQKAGGSAMAGTIESKLNPYYEKYGLVGSTITIDKDGKFELKVKGMAIKGTIEKNSDDSFNFTFTPFGGIKLGTIKTYIEKPVGGLDIMFDAKKLKNILSVVAGFTGNSLAQTASSVLDSYDGLCVGFAYKGNGPSTSTGNGNAASSLLDALTGKGNSQTGGQTNQQTTTNSQQQGTEKKSSASDLLKNLFGK